MEGTPLTSQPLDLYKSPPSLSELNEHCDSEVFMKPKKYEEIHRLSANISAYNNKSITKGRLTLCGWNKGAFAMGRAAIQSNGPLTL